MKTTIKQYIAGFLGGLVAVVLFNPLWTFAADWYVASGKPVVRSAMNSADMRTEFSSIQSGIADKLPILTGNGLLNVRVNAGGTALEAASIATSGSFVASFTDACSTTPTVTFAWLKIDNAVFLQGTDSSGFNCTGDSINFATANGDLPAGIRPTLQAQAGVAAQFVDNGTSVGAYMQLDFNGKITFRLMGSLGGIGAWTASGNRSTDYHILTMSYLITP